MATLWLLAGHKDVRPKALSRKAYILNTTTTSAMTPRAAIKPAMVPDVKYGKDTTYPSAPSSPDDAESTPGHHCLKKRNGLCA
jgi:hypothetical protein